MHNIFRFFHEFRFPKRDEMERALRSFSKAQWIAWYVFFTALVISTLILVRTVNNHFMVSVPANDGTITEGVVGTPRFVNPLLAVSDSEKDLSALVYSGLMRKTSSGELIPDLAERYDVSPDGLTYTFTLKQNAEFQDNTKVTADDVVFTINMAENPTVRSPKKVNWGGVAVEKVDDATVRFVLKQPFASFLENTTLGILPSHIWKNVPAEEFNFSDFNVSAVGSGPYEIKTINKKSSSVPDSYELVPFNKFTLGRPHIAHVIIKFYPNESDLLKGFRNGEVDQISAVTGMEAKTLKEEGYTIDTTVLPRIFGLFFNQSQAPIFTDKSVIKAFSMAIDKQTIIENVLSGYGIPINSPVPENMLGADATPDTADTSSYDAAAKILDDAGWKMGANGIRQKTDAKKKTQTLSFSLATGDTPELKRSAELIKGDLEKIGASVDLKVFEVGALTQTVIRPRKYDALFFGQIVNHASDLFAFWHSSKRIDPGLNIALYTSAKADKLLESAFAENDEAKRVSEYAQFEQEVKKDMPAVFIYSPDFVYAVSPQLSGLDISNLSIPSERFNEVYNWYVRTDRVWKVFSK